MLYADCALSQQQRSFMRGRSRDRESGNFTVKTILPRLTCAELLPERDRALDAAMSPLTVSPGPMQPSVLPFSSQRRAAWIAGECVGVSG